MSNRETSKPLAKLASKILREDYIPTESEIRSMAGSLLSQYEHDDPELANFENLDELDINVLYLRPLDDDTSWTPSFREDEAIFTHFAGGSSTIHEDDIDDFMAVAIAHGWGVELT